MKLVKQDNGLYMLKDVVIWTEGRFRGFGSPAEGDEYNQKDLKQIVKSHYDVNPEPRIYYGHPINPTLALMAKPKGDVDDLRVVGKKIVANVYNMPRTVAEEAIKDKVRLSPDMKFNYLDPGTGKNHKWLITGVAMLGAKAPGNKLIPNLGDQLQLDPSKFYTEMEDMNRAYSEAGARSFVLDFTGRFLIADPEIVVARTRIQEVRAFAAAGISNRTRTTERDAFLRKIMTGGR